MLYCPSLFFGTLQFKKKKKKLKNFESKSYLQILSFFLMRFFIFKADAARTNFSYYF